MRSSFLLIVFFILSNFCQGQNSSNNFGLKGGLNYSSFIDNNDEDFPVDYSGKVGFYIGAYHSFEIKKNLKLSAEVIFTKQNSDFSTSLSDLNTFSQGDDLLVPDNGNINESFIIVPVLLNIQVNEILDFGFGAQFGYVLNREVNYDNDEAFFVLKNDDDEKFELGVFGEVGFKLSEKIRTNLRYNYGILERQNLHSSTLQLGANYSF